MGKKTVKRKRPTVADQLRAAVDASDKTIYRIAAEAGIGQPILQRFMKRERDMRVETMAKVCAVLGLELTKRTS